ncbi:MAG: hypothetical protein V2A73_10095 [Pseudomonadota bacterium]
MKKLVLAFALSIVFAFESQASAKLFEIYAQAQGGSSFAGRQATADQQDGFFARASGWTAGGLVGAEVLMLDFWLEHNQYLDAGEVQATWTQLMVGADVDVPLVPRVLRVEFGLAIGAGAGTSAQVEPPLDKSEVTDRGLLAQAWVRLEHRFNRFVAIGAQIPLTFGYFIRSGAVNDSENRYSSAQGAVLVNLRFTLGL